MAPWSTEEIMYIYIKNDSMKDDMRERRQDRDREDQFWRLRQSLKNWQT
jgi:hypothetical protein